MARRGTTTVALRIAKYVFFGWLKYMYADLCITRKSLLVLAPHLRFAFVTRLSSTNNPSPY